MDIFVCPDVDGFGIKIKRGVDGKKLVAVSWVKMSGPAYQSGIKVNDKIVAINSIDVTQMKEAEVGKILLNCPPSSPTKFTILRETTVEDYWRTENSKYGNNQRTVDRPKVHGLQKTEKIPQADQQNFKVSRQRIPSPSPNCEHLSERRNFSAAASLKNEKSEHGHHHQRVHQPEPGSTYKSSVSALQKEIETPGQRDCFNTKCKNTEAREYVYFPCGHSYCNACIFELPSQGPYLFCGMRNCEKWIEKKTLDTGFCEWSTEKTTASLEIGRLQNIGLTCYANSIFQVLAQTPSLCDELQKTSSNSGKGSLTSLLLETLEQINTRDANEGLLRELMGIIFANDQSLKRYNQNDCHSFLMSLLNMIEQEGSDKTAADLFKGQLRNIFTSIPCNHTENTLCQSFLSLMLPMNPTKTTQTVEEGMRILMQKEEFESKSLKCRQCRKYDLREDKKTEKRLVIAKAPPILVLHIARFSESEQGGRGCLRKTDIPVTYKKELHVEEEDLDSNTRKKKRYELYGVVMHIGNLSFGHYYSFVRKDSSGKWYRCSDNDVLRMQEDRVVPDEESDIFSEGPKHVSLLFYKQI